MSLSLSWVWKSSLRLRIHYLTTFILKIKFERHFHVEISKKFNSFSDICWWSANYQRCPLLYSVPSEISSSLLPGLWSGHSKYSIPENIKGRPWVRPSCAYATGFLLATCKFPSNTFISIFHTLYSHHTISPAPDMYIELSILYEYSEKHNEEWQTISSEDRQKVFSGHSGSSIDELFYPWIGQNLTLWTKSDVKLFKNNKVLLRKNKNRWQQYNSTNNSNTNNTLYPTTKTTFNRIMDCLRLTSCFWIRFRSGGCPRSSRWGPRCDHTHPHRLIMELDLQSVSYGYK